MFVVLLIGNEYLVQNFTKASVLEGLNTQMCKPFVSPRFDANTEDNCDEMLIVELCALVTVNYGLKVLNCLKFGQYLLCSRG